MTHHPVATRGDGANLVDSQVTERHQAQDTPAVWDAAPPIPYERVLPVFAFFTILVVGLFVPRPAQIGIGVGVVVVGLVALATATRETR